VPFTLIAGSIGVWLFYVQHQFDPTFWARNTEWTFQEPAPYGSSYYDLPAVLRWFTANIGVHYVHHLCSRIPYYRLPTTLRDHPELRSSRSLGSKFSGAVWINRHHRLSPDRGRARPR
jgi:acyl-lipid omega-6 desaturase (Delta-12 desaturase)